MSRVTPWLIVGGVALAASVVIYLAPDDVPVDLGGDGDASVDAGTKIVTERCLAGKVVHLIGPPILDGDREQPVAPFAPELGRAVVHDGGFAVGVKRQHEEKVVAELVLVSAAGEAETVALGALRGDVDPPMAVAAGDGFVVALTEPNASGMALRLARLEGTKLVWGDDLPQGRDESLAFDLAFGERGGLVVWDDIEKEGARGYVALAKILPDLRRANNSPEQRVSRQSVDGEVPRLVARPGGFWLTYVARAPLDIDGGQGGEAPAAMRDAPDAGRYAAELIEPSWIELVPLDGLGQPEGSPRPVSNQQGHVLDYDLSVTSDGEALIVWRDDDTPSGAHGGRVSLLRVGMSGGGAMEVVAEDDVASGTPTLLQGLLAISDRHGRMRVAPLDPQGTLAGPLSREDTVGVGLPLAGSPEALLWARPAGGSLELLLVKCDPKLVPTDEDVTGEGGSTPRDGGFR